MIEDFTTLTTLPGNSDPPRTVKAKILRSIYTLANGIVDSPYTAANFSERGSYSVLSPYGVDGDTMTEAVQIIIDHACDMTGSPNLRIKPATTPFDPDEYGVGWTLRTTTDHPLNNTTDTRQPGMTQAQNEQNEMDIETTQNNRTESPEKTAKTVNPTEKTTAHEDEDTTPDLTPIELVENDDGLEQTRTGERERKSTPTLDPLLEMRLTKTLY